MMMHCNLVHISCFIRRKTTQDRVESNVARRCERRPGKHDHITETVTPRSRFPIEKEIGGVFFPMARLSVYGTPVYY